MSQLKKTRLLESNTPQSSHYNLASLLITGIIYYYFFEMSRRQNKKINNTHITFLGQKRCGILIIVPMCVHCGVLFNNGNHQQTHAGFNLIPSLCYLSQSNLHLGLLEILEAILSFKSEDLCNF